MSNARILVSALSLSAAALVGLAMQEGYTDKAVRPLPGDKWTNGFGSTTNDAGQPLKPGEAVTPPQALARKLRDVRKFEGALKGCVRVPLHQHEFDAWVQFIYNVGPDAFCTSTAAKKLNAGDYEGACNEMLKWVNFKGKRVQGLVNRREQERRLCLGI